MLFESLSEQWQVALAPLQPEIENIESFISGSDFLPELPKIFAALVLPPEKCRVLIVGQDPYPDRSYARGLAFSVPTSVEKLPASLKNIFVELESDIGGVRRINGDLSDWVSQGVVLLNRTLTISPGESNSHARIGWSAITDQIVRIIEPHISAAILWGKNAMELEPLIGEEKLITSVHPSPLSAYRGFFGSRPFSQANQKLEDRGFTPISW